MRLRTKVFVNVLMSLFICRCNGAPPPEVGAGTSNIRSRYTEDEDRFIVEELTNLLEGPYNRHVWQKLSEKHRAKWEAGTEDFPQERTIASLRGRYANVLVFNSPDKKVQVPDSLRKKIDTGIIRNTDDGSMHRYTQEEDNFIMEALSKPSSRTIFSAPNLDALRAEHDKKREAKIPGFENARTTHSLRSRIYVMRNNGSMPEEIRKRWATRKRGASTGQSSQQTDSQTAETSKGTSNLSDKETGETSQGSLELDDREIDAMVDELVNNTEWEFDYNKHPKIGED